MQREECFHCVMVLLTSVLTDVSMMFTFSADSLACVGMYHK